MGANTGRFQDVFGNVYEGEVCDGKAHGYGTYTFANGDTITGEFVNGRPTVGVKVIFSLKEIVIDEM